MLKHKIARPDVEKVIDRDTRKKNDPMASTQPEANAEAKITEEPYSSYKYHPCASHERRLLKRQECMRWSTIG